MSDRSDRAAYLAQVDAFADRPFTGNPAAVCLLSEAREDRWLQALASEMNLSETAFPMPLEGDGGGGASGDFSLRWFTPSTEVDLCGHATLASAHVLGETGRVEADRPIRFRTRSGVLTCERETSAAGEGEEVGAVWMDFPAGPPSPVDGNDPADPGNPEAGSLGPAVAAALNAEPVVLARNRFDLFVELASEWAVRDVRPDMARLAAIGARGVIVTAAGDDGAAHDFVSRFFGPRVGVPEDPVTGSAHCGLAPWWAERLGRDRLTGYQASARGGTVRTVVAGDRVRLGGRAVTVFTGRLHAGSTLE